METRDLYSIEEARKRLGGISRNSIYLMLRAGQLPSVVLGCRRFIAAKAIADLIASSSTLASPSAVSSRSKTFRQSDLQLSLPSAIQAPRTARSHDLTKSG